jgi:hypothetical protein
MVDLRSQVIDLTEAQFSATLRNGNGHANGSTSANGHTDGATAHIHLDPIPSNGHTKEPAPDGTTSAT